MKTSKKIFFLSMNHSGSTMGEALLINNFPKYTILNDPTDGFPYSPDKTHTLNKGKIKIYTIDPSTKELLYLYEDFGNTHDKKLEKIRQQNFFTTILQTGTKLLFHIQPEKGPMLRQVLHKNLNIQNKPYTILLVRKNLLELYLSFLLQKEILLKDKGFDMVTVKGKKRYCHRTNIYTNINKSIIENIKNNAKKIIYKPQVLNRFIESHYRDLNYIYNWPMKIDNVCLYEDLQGNYSIADSKKICGNMFKLSRWNLDHLHGEKTEKTWKNVEEKLSLIKNIKEFNDDWKKLYKSINLNKNNNLWSSKLALQLLLNKNYHLSFI